MGGDLHNLTKLPKILKIGAPHQKLNKKTLKKQCFIRLKYFIFSRSVKNCPHLKFLLDTTSKCGPDNDQLFVSYTFQRT